MPEPHEDPISESGSTPSDVVVHVRHPRWMWNSFAVAWLSLVAIVFFYPEEIPPKDQQLGREFLPWGYGICIFFAAMSYLIGKKTIIRIDAQGVTAERRRSSLTATTVPWDEIASCDFVKVGYPGPWAPSVIPVFRGQAGDVLFPNIGDLRSASKSDQARVLQALESRFGKPVTPPSA